MKVTYARLFNLGNYENERIEVEEEVDPSGDPAYTLRRLAQWVESQHIKILEERRKRADGEEEIPF